LACTIGAAIEVEVIEQVHHRPEAVALARTPVRRVVAVLLAVVAFQLQAQTTAEAVADARQRDAADVRVHLGARGRALQIGVEQLVDADATADIPARDRLRLQACGYRHAGGDCQQFP
jgi:hypothetical protein